jgi:hypothetical protein
VHSDVDDDVVGCHSTTGCLCNHLLNHLHQDQVAGFALLPRGHPSLPFCLTMSWSHKDTSFCSQSPSHCIRTTWRKKATAPTQCVRHCVNDQFIQSSQMKLLS